MTKCENCNKDVNETVQKYSMKKYNRVLCYACQTNSKSDKPADKSSAANSQKPIEKPSAPTTKSEDQKWLEKEQRQHMMKCIEMGNNLAMAGLIKLDEIFTYADRFYNHVYEDDEQ